MRDTIHQLAYQYENYLIEQRRHFHRHPELSSQEVETCKHICTQLKEMNIPYEMVGPTDIVGKIEGEKPGKKVAIRADIDALPAFYDSPPSFQNSRQAVKDAGGYAAVRVKDYASALFNPITGSIAEISVRPDMRCRGTGESLLACIKRECTGRTIRIVNVEAESLKSFLLGRGFELFAEQWEMVNDLQDKPEGLDVSVLPTSSVSGLPVALHPYG